MSKDVKIKIKADSSDAERGIEKTEKSIKKLNSSVGRAGKAFRTFGKVAAVATVAVGAFLFKAVKAAQSFRKEMARVNTMAKNSDIKVLSRQVKELSGEFGLAKTSLAEGFYQALSAGVPENNVFDFMKVAARSAVAGAVEAEVAVDALTNVINSYGLKASDAEHVSDLLFTTVRNGKTTFEEMAGQIGQVSSVAAQSGISMESLFASIATVTKGGIDTRRAITGMRSGILAVVAPSAELSKKFKEMGTSGAEMVKELGVQGAFQSIFDMAGGSVSEIKKLIPSIEALPTFLAMTGSKAEGASKDLKDMADAIGAMGDAESKMTVEKDIDKLTEKLNTIFIDMGEATLPELLPQVEKLSDALSEMSVNGELAVTLKAVGDSVAFIAKGIANVATSVHSLGGAAGDAYAKGEELNQGKTFFQRLNPIQNIKDSFEQTKTFGSSFFDQVTGGAGGKNGLSADAVAIVNAVNENKKATTELTAK